MLGKTNAVSGKQKYGAYNIEEVEVDGGVVLEITDADEKPVDKLQLRIDGTNSCAYLFHYYSGVNKVMEEMLAGLDTSNVTDMSSMFNNCYNLTMLDVSNFNTSNVRSMSSMFNYCYNLPMLDVSSFDTSNVTNMGSMFNNCSRLSSLDLSSFNTENVTSMGYMFYYCSKLTSIDLSSFNTENVMSMSNMFEGANKLTTIQGTLDLYSAASVSRMFDGTNALTGVTLKNIRKSLQIGQGSKWGHLWELSYLINAVKELWDLTDSDPKTLTTGTANLEKIANVYVKLVDVTDEMIAQDPYAANKLPCVECASTDEGAMTLTAYAGLKNWGLA